MMLDWKFLSEFFIWSSKKTYRTDKQSYFNNDCNRNARPFGQAALWSSEKRHVNEYCQIIPNANLSNRGQPNKSFQSRRQSVSYLFMIITVQLKCK